MSTGSVDKLLVDHVGQRGCRPGVSTSYWTPCRPTRMSTGSVDKLLKVEVEVIVLAERECGPETVAGLSTDPASFVYLSGPRDFTIDAA